MLISSVDHRRFLKLYVVFNLNPDELKYALGGNHKIKCAFFEPIACKIVLLLATIRAIENLVTLL